MNIGYLIIQILFIIGMIMFVSGYLISFLQGKDSYGRSRTLDDMGTDAASALALLIVYAMVIVSVDNGMEFAQAICGGLPFIDSIADFGSIKAVFCKAPFEFVKSFCDVVILSAIIGILKKLFGVSRKSYAIMSHVFSGIIAALIGLFILNFVVKNSDTYAKVVTVLGGVLSSASVFSALLSLLSQGTAATVLLSLVAIFSNNPISQFFRKSLFDAILYVVIIWALETFFGGLSTGVGFFANLIVAFAPAAIMIMGIIILLKSLK